MSYVIRAKGYIAGGTGQPLDCYMTEGQHISSSPRLAKVFASEAEAQAFIESSRLRGEDEETGQPWCWIEKAPGS